MITKSKFYINLLLFVLNATLFFFLLQAVFAPFIISCFMSFVAFGKGRTASEVKDQLSVVSIMVRLPHNSDLCAVIKITCTSHFAY